MITIVYYDEYESEYSEKSGSFQEAISDSSILTVTENLTDSIKAVEKHQKENEDSDIDYYFQFWNAGEQCSAVRIGGPIQDHLEELNQHLKSFLH